MSCHLVLSHPSDYDRVFVPKHITNKLNKYHLQMIRDIYYCMNKKKQGILLNVETEMEESLSISAYLRAICSSKKEDTPILIISNDENYAAWHFNLKKYSGLDLYELSEQNANNLFNKYEQIVILMKSNLIKLLDNFKYVDLFMVIVENIEEVVTKRIFNRLSGDFNIGITYRNFFKNRDHKLLWKTLNWLGDESIGKYNQFSKFDEEYLNMAVDPYQDTWFHYKWEEYKKPKLEELQSFNDKLHQWSIDNNLTPTTSTKTSLKKRKNTDESSKTKNKTSKLADNQENETLNINMDITNELSENPKLDNVTLKSPKKREFTPTSRKSLKLQKHVSASHLEYIDRFVIDEFSRDEFTPKNKLPRSKSDMCIQNNKIIDKFVLEEFAKDFQVEYKEREKYHAQMDIDILTGVSDFLNKKDDSSNILNKTETESLHNISTNILNIDELLFKNTSEKDEEIIPATEELSIDKNTNKNNEEIIPATQEFSIDELFNNGNEKNEEIIPTQNKLFSNSQSISSKYNNDEDKSFLLNLLDMRSSKEDNILAIDGSDIKSSQKVSSGSSIQDIFNDLFLDKRDYSITKELIDCCSVGSFSKLLGTNNGNTFKDNDNLMMKKQILNSLFGNEDIL